MGQKLTQVGTFSQITTMFHFFLVCKSGSPTNLLYFLGFLFVIFLAHVFSFWLTERLGWPGSGLKQTTHYCRLTTRVGVKVFTFSTLYGDSTHKCIDWHKQKKLSIWKHYLSKHKILIHNSKVPIILSFTTISHALQKCLNKFDCLIRRCFL